MYASVYILQHDCDPAYILTFCFTVCYSLIINGFLKACVLYILRVGVVDQMMEPTQRSVLVILGNQVCWIRICFSMVVTDVLLSV